MAHQASFTCQIQDQIINLNFRRKRKKRRNKNSLECAGGVGLILFFLLFISRGRKILGSRARTTCLIQKFCAILFFDFIRSHLTGCLLLPSPSPRSFYSVKVKDASAAASLFNEKLMSFSLSSHSRAPKMKERKKKKKPLSDCWLQ